MMCRPVPRGCRLVHNTIREVAMVPITSLWLPILVSAVLVFAASSLIHMALGYHHSDWKQLPSQDALQEALRPFNIPPGDYMLPRPTKDAPMSSPEFKQKVAKGPVLVMTTWSGMNFMGKSLALWFVYVIVVSTVAGYVAGAALPPGTRYLSVFRFAGTVAFASYALALPQHSIWYRRSWSTTFKSVFDGLIYALVTAGAFGWLWPK